MIRFLSGKLKKYTKLAKIVKISIFVNRLVFPMNFNRLSHPMTLTHVGSEKDDNRVYGPMRWIPKIVNLTHIFFSEFIIIKIRYCFETQLVCL